MIKKKNIETIIILDIDDNINDFFLSFELLTVIINNFLLIIPVTTPIRKANANDIIFIT